MRHRTVVTVVTALAIVLGAAFAGVHGQSLSGEYKIGVLEPLTGPLAGEGKRHLEGYEIVRDMINERGGVMGKKLVFVAADAPDPTAAASEANRRRATTSSTGRAPASIRASTSAASRPSSAPRSTPPGSAGTTSSSSSSIWRRAST